MGQLLDTITADPSSRGHGCVMGKLLDTEWGDDLRAALELYPQVTFIAMSRSLKDVADIKIHPSSIARHHRGDCACTDG